MSEHIELQSFKHVQVSEGDIEEYQEVDPEAMGDGAKEHSLLSNYSETNIKENDFFTNVDAQRKTKNIKKKKIRRNQPSIMDAINTEFAACAPLIKANFIELNTPQNSSYNYKERTFNTSFIKRTYNDAETGLYRRKMTNLSHNIGTFTNDFSNEILETSNVLVEFVNPTKIEDDLVSINFIEVTPKFLSISLQKSRFEHHHMFNLETLLWNKLIEKHAEYTKLNKTMEFIYQEIKVNRDTKDSLKNDFSIINHKSNNSLRFDTTIRKYVGKLLDMKEKLLDCLHRKKGLSNEILTVWSDIELIRAKNSNSEVPYVFEVSKFEKTDEDYDNEWTEVFNTELADVFDKIEYDYVTKYIEYKDKKKHIAEKDSELLSKPKLYVNNDEAKEEAEMLTNQIVCKENLHFFIRERKDLTPAIQDLRPKTLFYFYFKFYVDDIFICESEQCHITQENFLCIQFEELLSAQILPHNSVVRITLCENEEEISSVNLNIEEVLVNGDKLDSVIKFMYDKDKIIIPNIKFVGCGHTIKDVAKANKIRLKSSNMFKGAMCSTFQVNLNVVWDSKLNKDNTDAIKMSELIGIQLKKLIHGKEIPTLESLKSIISYIYEKDIDADETMVKSLQKLCQIRVTTDDNFPLDENSAEYTRLKLLHLRNSGGFADVENKLIPLHSSQISTAQLNSLHHSTQKPFEFHYLADHEDMDPIELQRFISTKYVQKLNKNLTNLLHDHLFRKTHKDVVKEFQDFRNMFSNGPITSLSQSMITQQRIMDSLNNEIEVHVTIMKGWNLMDRSSTILDDDEIDDIAGYKVRPLRPFVKISYGSIFTRTATGIGCHPTWNQSLKLKVKPNPLQSLQINIFDEYKTNIKENSEDEYSSLSKTLHFRYYNKWLGTIQVPLWSVLSMELIRGTFILSSAPIIFGYEKPVQKESNSLIPEVTQLLKKECSFLSLQITTSLSNLGGFNGNCCLPIPNSPEDDYLIKHLNTFVTKYVNVFPSRNILLSFIDSDGKNRCATQFIQPIPLPAYEHFPKNPKFRTESAMSKSSGMSKSSSSKSSSGRRKDVDIEKQNPTCEEKESVYSLYEGTWKNEDGQLNKLINTSLRYVSLIPTYEIHDTNVVTLTGLELLKLLYGSPLDHSILLASYFLYLGIKCWIAIGTGLPRGFSNYVLTKCDSISKRIFLVNDPLQKKKSFFNRNDGCTWYVFDASNGERHELRDVSCPLKTISYVFDNENIWVNIQQSLDCENVFFDFSKSSEWQPVFDNSIFVMKLSVVTDSSLYSRPPEVERLRQSLETKIRAKVQKWRTHVKTIWNRYCSSLLQESLVHWEYWSFNPSESKPLLNQKLKQLMVTYKMYGFPINVPYANTKHIISTIKSTAIYASDDPTVEFGLGVEVFPYPNNVLSVWIYFASITRI